MIERDGMMYFELADYEQIDDVIKRSDGVFIPMDERNKDYQEYIRIRDE